MSGYTRFHKRDNKPYIAGVMEYLSIHGFASGDMVEYSKTINIPYGTILGYSRGKSKISSKAMSHISCRLFELEIMRLNDAKS